MKDSTLRLDNLCDLSDKTNHRNKIQCVENKRIQKENEKKIKYNRYFVPTKGRNKFKKKYIIIYLKKKLYPKPKLDHIQYVLKKYDHLCTSNITESIDRLNNVKTNIPYMNLLDYIF